MLLAVVFLISSALFAQTSRGTVTGIVTDSSGSAVPAATVELKGTQTGVVRSTTTNQSGVYRFDAVDLGEHDLTVKANGFRTFANRAFNVQAAQTIGLDVRLEVGDNVSIIEVSAQAELLQTESPVRGGTISSIQAINLPNFGRNPVMLAITLPGVNRAAAEHGRYRDVLREWRTRPVEQLSVGRNGKQRYLRRGSGLSNSNS